MTTAPTDARGEVATFVAAVRARFADLGPEEREELLGGLEADLADLVVERGPGVLGDPEAYAAELRAAAGLPAADPGRARAALSGSGSRGGSTAPVAAGTPSSPVSPATRGGCSWRCGRSGGSRGPGSPCRSWTSCSGRAASTWGCRRFPASSAGPPTPGGGHARRRADGSREVVAGRPPQGRGGPRAPAGAERRRDLAGPRDGDEGPDAAKVAAWGSDDVPAPNTSVPPNAITYQERRICTLRVVDKDGRRVQGLRVLDVATGSGSR